MRCDICEEEVKPQVNGWQYGNNAEPVVPYGRCCDQCNQEYVIPARLLELQKRAEGENNAK